jgi:hypothetical protein
VVGFFLDGFNSGGWLPSLSVFWGSFFISDTKLLAQNTFYYLLWLCRKLMIFWIWFLVRGQSNFALIRGFLSGVLVISVCWLELIRAGSLCVVCYFVFLIWMDYTFVWTYWDKFLFISRF